MEATLLLFLTSGVSYVIVSWVVYRYKKSVTTPLAEVKLGFVMKKIIESKENLQWNGFLSQVNVWYF